MSNTYHRLDELNPKAHSSLGDDQSPNYAEVPPPFPHAESSISGKGTSSLQEDLEEGTSQSSPQNDQPPDDVSRILFCLIIGFLLMAFGVTLVFQGDLTSKMFGILMVNISVCLACIAGAIVFGVERITGERAFLKGIGYGIGFTLVFSAICMIIKWKIS